MDNKVRAAIYPAIVFDVKTVYNKHTSITKGAIWYERNYRLL